MDTRASAVTAGILAFQAIAAIRASADIAERDYPVIAALASVVIVVIPASADIAGILASADTVDTRASADTVDTRASADIAVPVYRDIPVQAVYPAITIIMLPIHF